MTIDISGRRPGRGDAVRKFVFALAAVALTANVAYGEEMTVKIDNFAFTPETITVKPGTTVTWDNEDDIPHTVVASKQAFFRSKPMDTGEKYSFTFTTAGAFEYFCGLHPHMKGMIIVAP